MKAYKRTSYDKGLPKGFRWVRVREILQKTDEALDLVYETWGRTGRAGQRNHTSKAYRRHFKKGRRK